MPTSDLRIAGTFDDLGLITGAVSLNNGFELLFGDLSGLLGQEGAVAAFHSTATGADAYSGGFYRQCGC